MDPVTAAIGLGAMAAAAAALAVRRRLSARGRAWRAAAAAAGLRDVAVSSGSRSLTGLAGETDPLQVHLRRYRTSVKDSRGTGFTYGTTVTVSPLGYRSDLQFYHDRLDTPAENGPQPGRGLLVGDPALERAVVLHGSADVACALFDEPTRRLVLALLRGGIEGPGHRWAATLDSVALGNRGLEVLVNESWERGAARLIDVLPGLIAAARQLRRPADIGTRLAHNLRQDPLPAVRLANLRALLDHHTDHAEARPALVAALGDADEEVRLRAALAIGEDGRPALLEIASGEASEDGRAARAVAALEEHLPTAQALVILRQSLKLRRLRSAAACVEVLGGRRGADVVELLATVLAVERQELAAAAARALAATGEPAAEAHLLPGLNADAHEVRLAVAGALAQVGTAAAVLPLRTAAERYPEGGLAGAARRAVESIQSRLQGAAPGQLSLSTGDAGQVSLAGGENVAGRLSTPEESR
jgi:hypothetical protein